MAAFLTPLRCEQVTEDDWVLVAPLRYQSTLLNREIVAPEGFVTDFNSTPRMPFIYWYTGGKAAAPACIHDWLYRTNSQDVTRVQADDVLAEAMEARGYWRARSWFMWAGVRLGGHWAFETRSTQALLTNSDSRPLTTPPSTTPKAGGRPPEQDVYQE